MKKKKVISFLIMAIMILAIVGCSQQDKGVEEPIDVEEEVAKEPTEEEAVEEEAVAEEASEKLEDKLLIYSTHSEDLISMVADEFEKETGVTVEFINLKGELAERVEAEKNNPQADVMFGGASNLFMDLKE